jgi:hypothetical protein
MVKGLDRFRKHFEGHSEHYILIGGTACEVRFADKALWSRATKDLDIILVAEALSNEFVQHFWEFIRAGGYGVAQMQDHKRFYRFQSPTKPDYPAMLELFCRHPNALPPAEGLHITDIPTGEEVSSLSAILMDDDYYQFTLRNSNTSDGLHLASDIALIALKAKAFLNNRERKQEGQNVQEFDIAKHRNDVIRLTATIGGVKAQQVPGAIRMDMVSFIQLLTDEPDNVKQLLNPMGITGISKETIIEQLRVVFDIDQPTAEVVAVAKDN